MRKFFVTGLLCILLGITYLYRDDIVNFYNKKFMETKKVINDKVKLEGTNNYYRNMSFNYVKIANDFKPQSRQDIYNIYYTAINAGKSKFTFYCPESYSECLDEIKYIANDQVTLSNINNFVHPYNSFKHVETTYDTEGKVSIEIDHTYSKDEIDKVNEKIKKLEAKLQDDSLSVEDQIKKYHDYIIDNTEYDSDRSDRNIINYRSETAYGLLVQGYALCGGYTDTMAILLNNMGLTNYKVSSNHHVWNAVEIDNKWYNLDLTWDDPVTQDGTKLVEHDFFLIDTNTLQQIEKTEHYFDENVYSELKSN